MAGTQCGGRCHHSARMRRRCTNAGDRVMSAVHDCDAAVVRCHARRAAHARVVITCRVVKQRSCVRHASIKPSPNATRAWRARRAAGLSLGRITCKGHAPTALSTARTHMACTHGMNTAVDVDRSVKIAHATCGLCAACHQSTMQQPAQMEICPPLRLCCDAQINELQHAEARRWSTDKLPSQA